MIDEKEYEYPLEDCITDFVVPNLLLQIDPDVIQKGGVSKPGAGKTSICQQKFKVGDYVEVISSYFTARVGLKGTVTEVNKSNIFTVRHDNDIVLSYNWDELKKIDKLPKFQTGDFVQVVLKNDVYMNMFGVVIFVNENTKQVNVKIGINVFSIYSFDCISKPSLKTFPGSKEFKRRAIVQVKGTRHKYSGRYGIIINEILNPNSYIINFGDSNYSYHEKNLKLI